MAEEQKGMISSKIRGMLQKTDDLLLRAEILAILLLVVVPNFPWDQAPIFVFTRLISLSLGLSCYRLLIGTTSVSNRKPHWYNICSKYLNSSVSKRKTHWYKICSAAPQFLGKFWFERTVNFCLLTLYHRPTKSWGIAFGFYVMSTICSSSILYFMPATKLQGRLPQNPSPRKTNIPKDLVQKFDILQRLMFWLERLLVVVCIFLISRFARFYLAFFWFSNFIRLNYYAMKLEVDPMAKLKISDYLVFIELIATIILELDCAFKIPYSLFIARGLFFVTNSCYIVHPFITRFIVKGLIPRAYTPKLREAKKGTLSEKNEAKREDEPQKEKLEVHQAENNNWEKELVAKYGFMDQTTEFTCTNMEDEWAKQKSEVHHQDEKNNSRENEYGYMERLSESTWTKPEDTTNYEYKEEEEAPKEERYSWEEELIAKYGLMEHVSEFTCTRPQVASTSNIQETKKEEDLEIVEAPNEDNITFFDEGSPWQRFDDMSSEGLDPYDYFDRYGNVIKVDDKCGYQLAMADQIATVSGNGGIDEKHLMEYLMKSTTAENESNKEALLEVTGEVVRLRAENDSLKTEKEALEREKKSMEDKLKAQRLELEETLLAWRMDSQKLDAMLAEEKMNSQALVEELDSHSKFEEEMLETLKTYKKDCTKWEKESKEISAKFEDVIAAIGKDQHTLLNGEGHDCKYKKERKKWRSEKIALKEQLVAANSWYQYYFQVATTASYWNQYFMQRQYDNRFWMQYYDHYISSLVKSNTDLAKRLEVETSLSTRNHNGMFDYEERCRKLEEDKNNLTAKLCAANASSELYRSMLHDLAS